MRINGTWLDGRLDIYIEISSVQVVGRNTIAIFGQLSWGIGLPRSKLKPLRCREQARIQVLISCDFDAFNNSLDTLFDVERDIDLWFAVDGSSGYLHVFVPAVPVQGLHVVSALLQEFLTDSAVAPDVGLLHRHLVHQLLGGQSVI